MIFNIKHGLKENLQTAEKVQGCWYVTDDTYELYYCPDGKELVCMNKMEPFDPSPIYEQLESVNAEISSLKSRKILSTVLELPVVGNSNIVYYIESQGASYMWDDVKNRYCRIGTDYNILESIRGGTANAIDRNNKKI